VLASLTIAGVRPGPTMEKTLGTMSRSDTHSGTMFICYGRKT